jgi:hypothetical protein
MIRSVPGILLSLLGATCASAAGPATKLETLANSLLAHGFSDCATTGTFKNCTSHGALSDGRNYSVSVFAGEGKNDNNVTIFVQPEDAINSKEVESIYQYLVELLPYDKGKLKDRFPDLKSSKAFCDTAPRAVHVETRCVVVEPVGELGDAVIGGGKPPSIDHWQVSWPVAKTAPTRN